MRNLRIVADVDDTTLDFLGELLYYINRDHKLKIRRQDIRSWDLTSHIPLSAAQIAAYISLPELYEETSPMPGAMEIVPSLRRDGHVVTFATAADNQGKWLRLIELGLVWEDEQYAVAEDKWKLPGDVLVDDKPEAVRNFNGFAILYDAPHNQDFAWPVRAYSWWDVQRFVKSFAQTDKNTRFQEIVGPKPPVQAPAPRVQEVRGPDGVVRVALAPEVYVTTVDQLGLTTEQWEDALRQIGTFLTDTGADAPASYFAQVRAAIGKDAPTAVSANGVKQSKLDFYFTGVDPLAMFRLAQILQEGAEKYGKFNWRGLSVEDNLGHALSHIYGYLLGDRSEDHLGHAFSRLMFALSKDMTPGDAPWMQAPTE